MNPVIRGAVIYLFLLILFRIMGKRSLSETTTFDFILLLIISEVTQQALVGQDASLTGAMILISTLLGLDLALTLLKVKSKVFAHVSEGVPLIRVNNGQCLRKRMDKCKVDEDDVMHAARLTQGIESIDQVKYAVLEKDGSISIIPYDDDDKKK